MTVRVIPLICPDCSRELVGLAHDQTFFCPVCQQGLFPGEDGWRRYPLCWAASQRGPGRNLLYLPLWELQVEVEAAPVNSRQELALRQCQNLDRVWVMGFTMIRPSFFGDLGLIYTEARVKPGIEPRPPESVKVAGCTRTEAEAMRYAQLFVTLILDKRADVTGMGIELRQTNAALWAIPFLLNGDKLMDLVTGTTFPAFAVDDLEAIRKLNRRK